MKILQVVPSLDERLGGPTAVVLGLSRALKESGVDVTVATVGDRNANPARELASGVLLHTFPSSIIKRRQFIVSQQFNRWISRHAKDFDLIDIHYLFTFTTLVATYHAHHQRVPYIMRTMGQLAPWALAQSRLIKCLYGALIEKRALRKARLVLCTSQQEQDELKSFGIVNESRVLPLGIDQPQLNKASAGLLRAKLGLPDNSKILLFLSRLHPKKRVRALIESFSQLRERPDWYLVIAGEGDPAYMQELQEIVRLNTQDKKIIFVGFVPFDSKALFFEGADLFCLPSVTENFGIAVAEALSFGLPALISDGIQQSAALAAQGAAKIFRSDVELQDTLLFLTGDESARVELSKKGSEYANKKLIWSSVVKEYIALYQEVIQKNAIDLKAR